MAAPGRRRGKRGRESGGQGHERKGSAEMGRATWCAGTWIPLLMP
jgi:hypothetical protein